MHLTGWIEAVGGCLTLAAAGWTVGQARREPGARPPPWWRAVLVLAVICLRWPGLLAPHEFSPDESQSLAGALTLLHDPRFWISVDGATAGPVHFFAQLPAALAPGVAAYTAARMLALLLVVATVFVAGRIARRAAGGAAEQIVVLTAAVAWALSRTPDLQHFSTEIVPVFLITLALGLAPPLPDPPSRARWIGVGLLLGLVPLAKLQLAPVAAAAAVFLGVRARRGGRAGLLVIGTLAPLAATAAYLTLAGAWDRALVPYVFNNVSYVGDGFTILPVLRELLRSLWADRYVLSWATVALAVVVAAQAAPPPERGLQRVGAAWFALSAVCLLIPRRPYVHYLYLLLPAAVVLVAVGLRRLLSVPPAVRRPRTVAAGALVAFLLPLAVVRATHPDGLRWLSALFGRWHRQDVALAQVIAPYRRPGDTLAVWGYRSDLYVTTGLPQAIPEAHTQTQLMPGRWQPWFLRAFATAFARERPAFFIDAVGPGNFLFEDRRFAHEALPPLRSMVAAGYTRVADRFGTRVYVRNDRLAAARLRAGRSPPRR